MRQETVISTKARCKIAMRPPPATSPAQRSQAGLRAHKSRVLLSIQISSQYCVALKKSLRAYLYMRRHFWCALGLAAIFEFLSTLCERIAFSCLRTMAFDTFTLAYRCGGSTGIGVFSAPVSRLTE